MIDELAPVFGHDPQSIGIENIGIKPGEKMYEELMSHEETRRVWELPNYFAVLPAFTSLYRDVSYGYPKVAGKKVENPYNSGLEENMDQEALARLLKDNSLLFQEGEDKQHPSQRYFP